MRPSKAEEVRYRKQLNKLTSLLVVDSALINRLIKDGASLQEIINALDDMLTVSAQTYDNNASTLSSKFVDGVNKTSKLRIEKIYAQTLGVDTAKVLDDNVLREAFDIAIQENVALIKSIPQQHFGKVIEAVTNNFFGKKQVDDKTFTQRLKEIGDITHNRARFIARDQTAKLNANFTRLRHENVGVKKYIWRTAQDERVVGDPSGRYPPPVNPQAHGNHYQRDGEIVYYNKPFADGHPGDAYNCRCYEEPILDLEDANIITGG